MNGSCSECNKFYTTRPLCFTFSSFAALLIIRYIYLSVTRHHSMLNRNNSCGATMPRLTVLKCTKCGKGKELRESLLKKQGDWACQFCSCNNFANRSFCYRCGEKRVRKRVTDISNEETSSSKKHKS